MQTVLYHTKTKRLKTLNRLLELRTEFENKHLVTPDYLLLNPADYSLLLTELSKLEKSFSIPVIQTTRVAYGQPIFVRT